MIDFLTLLLQAQNQSPELQEHLRSDGALYKLLRGLVAPATAAGFNVVHRKSLIVDVVSAVGPLVPILTSDPFTIPAGRSVYIAAAGNMSQEAGAGVRLALLLNTVPPGPPTLIEEAILNNFIVGPDGQNVSWNMLSAGDVASGGPFTVSLAWQSDGGAPVCRISPATFPTDYFATLVIAEIPAPTLRRRARRAARARPAPTGRAGAKARAVGPSARSLLEAGRDEPPSRARSLRARRPGCRR